MLAGYPGVTHPGIHPTLYPCPHPFCSPIYPPAVNPCLHSFFCPINPPHHPPLPSFLLLPISALPKIRVLIVCRNPPPKLINYQPTSLGPDLLTGCRESTRSLPLLTALRFLSPRSHLAGRGARQDAASLGNGKPSDNEISARGEITLPEF